MDDCIASCPTPEEAIQTIEDTRSALKQFNIRLHKIQSNSTAVVESFPATECKSSSELESEKTLSSALGVSWEPKTDKLIMNFPVPNHPFTKRGIILATINSIFDPFGLLSPIVLTGRLLQRSILPSKLHPNPATEKLDWDDPIPLAYAHPWNEWKASLQEAAALTINRSNLPPDFGVPALKELHAFGDASTGYVIYLRSVNEVNDVAVSFKKLKSS